MCLNSVTRNKVAHTFSVRHDQGVSLCVRGCMGSVIVAKFGTK